MFAFRLKNKTAIITGGDSGIGRAAAIMFAREGASGITITFLPEERPDAEDAKKMIEESGAKVHIVECDLMEESHCRMVVDEHIKHFTTLDIVVNNASKQMCVNSPIFACFEYRVPPLIDILRQYVREVREHRPLQCSLYIPVEYSSDVRRHEIRTSPPQAWLVYHQHYFRHRLQRKHRHGRLLLHQGSHRDLHPLTGSAACTEGNSSECSRSRACSDRASAGK